MTPLKLTSLVFCSVAVLGAGPFAHGQASTESDREDELVILSPFVVAAESDDYLAKETLAGMRIKTNMKDVTASVDVLTEKFLDDVGVVDMNQALAYIANMQDHAFSGDSVSNGVQWYSNSYISRGIRGTSVRIDYFPVGSVPIDRYNTENLTFLRGPNSILYGIGSPSGLVGASAKRAQLSKNIYGARVMVDSEGTLRAELDASQVLIRDKLAVRFDALSQDRKTFQDQYVNRRKGVYGTITYQPFKDTRITVNAESGHIDRNYLINAVVFDAYTPWVLAGKPTINWQTGEGQNAPGKGNYNQAAGSGLSSLSGSSYLVHIEGSDLPIMDWRSMARGQQWNNAVLSGPAGSGRMLAADRDQLANLSFTEANAITDITENVFGAASTHSMTYQRQAAFIEQKLLKNLDAELAWGRHMQEYEFYHFSTQPRLYVDPNELLPNGDPNPYVGMPYLETSARDTHRYRERNINEDVRLTLSYELNLDNHKIFRNIGLGHYRLAAMWEENQFDSRFRTTKLFVNETPLPGTPTANPRSQAQNTLVRRYYLQPGESGFRYDGITQFDQPIVPNGGTTGPISIREFVSPEPPRRIWQNSKGKVAAIQGSWWQSSKGYYHLTAMYGMRKDDRRDKTMTFARSPDGTYNVSKDTLEGIEAGGTWNPESRVTPTTKAYNVTVRPVSWLRLFHNYSDIFNSGASAFTDVFGNPLRPTFGETEDYGVKLDLWNERIFLSATKYKTAVVDQRFDNTGTVIGPINDIYNAIGRPELLLVRPSSYRDNITEGYEYSLTASITRNWNTRIAVGTQTTLAANGFNDFVVYYAQNRALWESNAAVPLLNPSSTYATVGDAIGRADQFLADARRVNGQRAQDQRSPNARFNTNYSFTDGALKGVRVGGGVRWESKNAIGYARDASGNLDLDRPYYGPDYLNVDLSLAYSRHILGGKAVWDIQLNVYNLLDDTTLIPRQAFDTGNGDPIYTRRSVRAPISAQLTNSIRF